MIKTLTWPLTDHQSSLATEPIFILAPRQLNPRRCLQLTRQLLAKLSSANQPRMIVWGASLQPHVAGLTDCPQFRTTSAQDLAAALADLTPADQHLIRIINYQPDAELDLVKFLQPKIVIGINGSWHLAFHYRPLYHWLTDTHTQYKLISPFENEAEARAVSAQLAASLPALPTTQTAVGQSYTLAQLFTLAKQFADQSFDYTFQTGAVLARPANFAAKRPANFASNQPLNTADLSRQPWQFLLGANNRVVPYLTYAWHHGASKETHLGPHQDLNYFDTNHAEVELILTALEKNLDLTGSSLIINLLPCPTCARMLTRTPITQVFYQLDHSAGAAHQILTASHKQVIQFPG